MLNDFANYLVLHWGAFVRKEGIEYTFNCPNCGDKNNHFSFNVEKGISNCFRCGYRPTPFEFLIERGNLKKSEASDLLKSREKKVFKDVQSNLQCDFPPGVIEIDKLDGGLKVLFEDWLSKNGVKMHDAKRLNFKIGVKKGLSGFGRIIIPVIEDSKMVYWLGRTMLDEVKPKYLFPPIPRKGILWGIDSFIEHEKEYKEVLICEGWKDAYKVGGVALLSKFIDNIQIEKILKRLPRDWSLGVMLDGDAFSEGYKIAKKFKSRGLNFIKLYNLMNKKDPGECADRVEAIKNSKVYDFNEFSHHIKAILNKNENKRI